MRVGKTGTMAMLLAGFASAASAQPADGGTTQGHTSYRPAASHFADAGARDISVAAGAGARVVRVPLDETVELGLSAFIRRAIEDNSDAAVLVLDINTLGGRVDAAIQIRDALLGARPRTVAFVHPRAISAGALIALACDVIVVSEGASIGAATPIQIGGSGQAEAVEEKMVSYMRTEMRTTAEARGRRGDIAEAMVDADVTIEGVVQSGKLLTLDTARALELHIADFQAQDIASILDAMGVEDPEIATVEINWTERIARVITGPTVSGLLMSIGMLALFIAFYTQDFAIPGTIGGICLGLFFAGHLIVHLAGWEEVMLFGVGVTLLGVELFVTPGFGLAGGLGIAAVLASLGLALVGVPLEVSIDTGGLTEAAARVAVSGTATIVLSAVAAKYLTRTPMGRRLVLSTSLGDSESAAASRVSAPNIGAGGTVFTALRPAGKATFDSRRYDVVSEGEFVDEGTEVRVIAVDGHRIVVRKVKP